MSKRDEFLDQMEAQLNVWRAQISQFDAKTLPDELNSLGFTVIENISQADWRIHYYDNEWIADLRPPSVARIIHVRIR